MPGFPFERENVDRNLANKYRIDRELQKDGTIFAGIASRKQTVVKPAFLRALFLLNAVAPRLVACELRRAAKQRS